MACRPNMFLIVYFLLMLGVKFSLLVSRENSYCMVKEFRKIRYDLMDLIVVFLWCKGVTVVGNTTRTLRRFLQFYMICTTNVSTSSSQFLVKHLLMFQVRWLWLTFIALINLVDLMSLIAFCKYNLLNKIGSISHFFAITSANVSYFSECYIIVFVR